MNADLRERLRRLGVARGVTHLKPAPRPPEEAPRAGASPGSIATVTLEPMPTAFGPAWYHRTVYPIGHTHGDRPLAAALDLAPQALARMGGSPDAPLREAIFLDTETTGLAGGSGTLAFLVGVGYFAGETADGRPRTADNGPRTADRGPQTEDGGRRTEADPDRRHADTPNA